MKTYAHPSKSVYLCNKNEIITPITKYVLHLLNVLIVCLYVVIQVEVEAEAHSHLLYILFLPQLCLMLMSQNIIFQLCKV